MLSYVAVLDDQSHRFSSPLFFTRARVSRRRRLPSTSVFAPHSSMVRAAAAQQCDTGATLILPLGGWARSNGSVYRFIAPSASIDACSYLPRATRTLYLDTWPSPSYLRLEAISRLEPRRLGVVRRSGCRVASGRAWCRCQTQMPFERVISFDQCICPCSNGRQ